MRSCFAQSRWNFALEAQSPRARTVVIELCKSSSLLVSFVLKPAFWIMVALHFMLQMLVDNPIGTLTPPTPETWWFRLYFSLVPLSTRRRDCHLFYSTFPVSVHAGRRKSRTFLETRSTSCTIFFRWGRRRQGRISTVTGRVRRKKQEDLPHTCRRWRGDSSASGLCRKG